MPSYTSALVQGIEAMATNASIANFKTFKFAKPEEINFDHDINYGDYTNGWTGTAASNANSHDICLMTYPKSTVTDVTNQRQVFQFSLYACRLLGNNLVKGWTKEQNFSGLDLKIWNLLIGMNSCDNKVLDTDIVRDYGLFNDKLMVVRADVSWEFNSVCPIASIIDYVICVDSTGTYVYPVG